MKRILYAIKVLLPMALLLLTAVLVTAQVNPALEWKKTLGGTDQDIIMKIVPAGNGNYLVTGFTKSPQSGDVLRGLSRRLYL